MAYLPELSRQILWPACSLMALNMLRYYMHYAQLCDMWIWLGLVLARGRPVQRHCSSPQDRLHGDHSNLLIPSHSSQTFCSWSLGFAFQNFGNFTRLKSKISDSKSVTGDNNETVVSKSSGNRRERAWERLNLNLKSIQQSQSRRDSPQNSKREGSWEKVSGSCSLPLHPSLPSFPFFIPQWICPNPSFCWSTTEMRFAMKHECSQSWLIVRAV